MNFEEKTNQIVTKISYLSSQCDEYLFQLKSIIPEFIKSYLEAYTKDKDLNMKTILLWNKNELRCPAQYNENGDYIDKTHDYICQYVHDLSDSVNIVESTIYVYTFRVYFAYFLESLKKLNINLYNEYINYLKQKDTFPTPDNMESETEEFLSVYNQLKYHKQYLKYQFPSLVDDFNDVVTEDSYYTRMIQTVFKYLGRIISKETKKYNQMKTLKQIIILAKKFI